MHGLCAHGRDAVHGEVRGQDPEGWSPASSQDPGGVLENSVWQSDGGVTQCWAE